MTRSASQVVEQLSTLMPLMVRHYHPEVGTTGATLSELIPGTAFFPGGAGLWRGPQPFGPMPEFFPDNPVMFVGHNFDSARAYAVSMERGGEAQSPFWRNLLAYLSHAGLEPGSATGPMPSTPDYKDECQAFLREQIRIVDPSLVVSLGGDASERVGKLKPSVGCVRLLHPSARELKPRATRQIHVSRHGDLLRDACVLARGSRSL